jgi:hypothetical protein
VDKNVMAIRFVMGLSITFVPVGFVGVRQIMDLAWRKQQWAQRIKAICADNANIAWTMHARKQMRDRQISMEMALDVLTKGSIRLQPEVDLKKTISFVVWNGSALVITWPFVWRLPRRRVRVGSL